MWPSCRKRLHLRAEPYARKVGRGMRDAARAAERAERIARRGALISMKIARAALNAGIDRLEKEQAAQPEPTSSGAHKIEVREVPE